MWETEPAPAGLTLFGLPDLKTHTTHAQIKIPYVLGLISTRSLDKPVEGIFQLVATAQTRIESGVIAYDGVEKLKANPQDVPARAEFEAHKRDLGFALLLKRYVADPRKADTATIQKAAWDTVPNVPVMFWIFRIMAGLGFAMIGFFGLAFIFASLRRYDIKWFLRLAVLMIPAPWIAIEGGWVLAEIGRQPWAVDGVLPTFLGASSLTVPMLWASIIGFTALYGTLAVIEVGLILRTIKHGPGAKLEPDPKAPIGAVAAAE
jgi:cytochrome d ubiquinol oxidase subunit I